MRFQINKTDKVLLPDTFNTECLRWESTEDDLSSWVSKFPAWHTVCTVCRMFWAVPRATLRQLFPYAQSRWCLTWICTRWRLSIGFSFFFFNMLLKILQFLVLGQNPHSSLLPLVFYKFKWFHCKSSAFVYDEK